MTTTQSLPDLLDLMFVAARGIIDRVEANDPSVGTELASMDHDEMRAGATLLVGLSCLVQGAQKAVVR
jgi:hypothetical protein